MLLASHQAYRCKFLDISLGTRKKTSAVVVVDQKCTAEVNERCYGYSSSFFTSILRAHSSGKILRVLSFSSICPIYPQCKPRRSAAIQRDNCVFLVPESESRLASPKNRSCCSRCCCCYLHRPTLSIILSRKADCDVQFRPQ